jgi:hypothetical protein
MTMGVLLVVLGLAGAGVVVDYLVENDLTSAPSEPFTVFGTTLHFSQPQLVLAALVIGALAVLLVILGIGLMRGSWGRRRALKRRIADLEQENTNLLTQKQLAEAARSDRDDGVSQHEEAPGASVRATQEHL